jgi:hypothetical protein
MRVLGVDPSNTRHAWALLEDGKLLGSGRDFTECALWRSADRVVIEMIASYGMAVGAHTFDTCVEIGILMHQLAMENKRISRITRIEVKRIVCRSVSANDTNIRAAIIDRFGGPTAIKKGGPLHGVAKDTWAAIAVALAAASGEAKWYVPIADKELME